MRGWILLSLVLLLLFSSLTFAEDREDRREKPPGDGDEDPDPIELEISLNSTCDGNIVLATSRDSPVEDVDVTVWVVGVGAPIFTGLTDENGTLIFPGCGIEVEIDANKDGYEHVNNFPGQLINCSLCATEEEEEDEEEPMSLYVTMTTGCGGNLIKVFSDEGSVENADVIVWLNGGSPLSGETNSNGYFGFEGCSMSAEVDVRKDGYESVNNFQANLIECSECEVPELPDENYSNETTEPPEEVYEKVVEQPGCVSNYDCAGDEYCYLEECVPMDGGCGYGQDHVWIPSECGPLGNDCPECQQGYACQPNNDNGATIYRCVVEDKTESSVFPEHGRILDDSQKQGIVLRKEHFPWLLLLLLLTGMGIVYSRRNREGKPKKKSKKK